MRGPRLALLGRLAFLAAFLLPEAPLDPWRGGAGPSLRHPLGLDDLGRDGLLRLSLAGARSLGFASLCALLALAVGLILALGGGRWRGALSALRNLPPLLFLLPLAAAFGGLPPLPLALLLGGLQALHLEAPLRARVEAFRHSPAWWSETVMGASPESRLRRWAPWGLDQLAPLFPSAWLGALWGEATLSALGLGPGPAHDSLGRLLAEELPRLATDATPLGWAALAAVLALAWTSTFAEPA
jgi:peptide/nickel transport system permease protein